MGALVRATLLSTTPWLALSLVALAADPVFEELLEQIDLDGDGTIDAAEYSRVDEVGDFASLDNDGSGQISAEELERWVRLTQPRPDAALARRASVGTASTSLPAPLPPPPEGDPGRLLHLAVFGLCFLLVSLTGGLLAGRRSRGNR